MTSSFPRLLVTGATGQLGRLVVAYIRERKPDAHITAMVRNVASAGDLADLGVTVVAGDYNEPASLDAAFVGIDRLLLISSNDLGARVAQHKNVIDAAQRAGVKLVIYTSLLHAETSTLGLANEHRATERDLRASGIAYAILRNGWYTENYTAGIAAALHSGTMLGSAANGRISAATRDDYAAAAATVLLDGAAVAEIFELAGDIAFTRAEFAQAVAHESGTPVTYTDLAQAQYTAALIGAGLPAEFADLLAESDAAAAHGALYDDSGTLSRLIGRPTTPLATAVAAALAPARAAIMP